LWADADADADIDIDDIDGGVGYDRGPGIDDGGQADRHRSRNRTTNGSPNHSTAGDAAPLDVAAGDCPLVPSTD